MIRCVFTVVPKVFHKLFKRYEKLTNRLITGEWEVCPKVTLDFYSLAPGINNPDTLVMEFYEPVQVEVSPSVVIAKSPVSRSGGRKTVRS
jgi:hypothetical protein